MTENFIQRNWRSAMAVQYLIVCAFDFMAAPLFMAWFAYITKSPLVLWVPITVQGGGLYHLSMGAICGITSYSKSLEKMSKSTVTAATEQ